MTETQKRDSTTNTLCEELLGRRILLPMLGGFLWNIGEDDAPTMRGCNGNAIEMHGNSPRISLGPRSKKKSSNYHSSGSESMYLDPPRGAQWMVRGAMRQPLRVQTPPLGGCWYLFVAFEKVFLCIYI